MKINYREFRSMYMYFYRLGLLTLPLKAAITIWTNEKGGGDC